MSYPVNLQALPGEVLQQVFTPENMRRRRSVGSLAQLAFPKSRLALWDGSAAGQKLRLQLCSHRKPRLVLLEKALRLAQRHARHSNKPRLHCFLLGSLSVNEDEDGVTVTLDRFDPGRDQAGTAAPSALLPGDVLVPCVVVQSETPHDAVVQSEAELHHCFKALQQLVSSRQTLDLSQLLKVKVHVVCRQQADATTFSLSWSAVCPAVPLDVQPVRAVPIIPTALLRALTGVGRPAPPAGRQRGFLTMDQSRKLVLLLESDPKASSLPLVGLWLSGVTHAYNPQVWAWSLRFMFGSSLQDRVLSELGCFLLVVFGSTHRTPQFFQCRDSRPGPGAQLDFQLLTASQAATLYQVAPVDGGALRCELGPEDPSRQGEAFRTAHGAFSRATPPAAGPSVSDQDSGVEDEDFSPRPSPSPHPPAAQARRVQPSVPELSLLIDGSFSSNHSGGQHSGPAHRLPPANRKPASPTASSSAAQPPPLPHLHSTPNSNLQQPCACCSAHNCTSIFPSPALLPAAVAPQIQQSAPLPPSSFPKASSPLASSQHYTPKHPSTPPLPPSSCHQQTPPLPPFCSYKQTPPPLLPPCSHPSTPPLPPSLLPPCSHPSTPPLPPPPLPPCPHAPPAPLWHADSLARPPCGNPCCEKVGGVLTSDTYQLLLHQDQQLRLLQAQVQMLLEAQGKLQTSDPQVQTATPRSTASVAVGTGASLFWGQSPDRLLLQEEPEPKPDPRTPPSSSSSASASSHDLSLHKPEEGASCSPSDIHSTSGLQSPVLGESVSMYGPPAEQQSFYQNLMTQLSSRLQESDSRQEAEDDSNRKSPSASHHSQSSQLSSSSSDRERDQKKKKRSPDGDAVTRATLRRLQQLGVAVDTENLTESDKNRIRAVETASTLATINPAAVVSRLTVSEATGSGLFAGGSVDLSLEANAIALRYLSQSQLSRLSLGGHAPSGCGDSLLSPSNMSLATRKYMRRYGLIEEEEDDEEEVRGQEARQPLSDALNLKSLPQSQLIRELRPKMQLLAGTRTGAGEEKENRTVPVGRTGPNGPQPEGSVGNILDLSRLRQLPKLF
ncbi:SCL-interrupting locus protein homolog [Xiphophorus hellerii]|uniref:SCL-interrupting locus protein homolog n=1 Tax=Xiphophorus hellerii TaxID=8084 RepID=UPI0013B46DBB|nr:SCL-interrupting locus protein [Xiphophorus hellerii]